ncbi:hypothetical protein C8R46DRAFT_1224208 [Mycena filopes]|nr:hypothetical protein C8R46DRAFT_1224208 [Mycena filopes]
MAMICPPFPPKPNISYAAPLHAQLLQLHKENPSTPLTLGVSVCMMDNGPITLAKFDVSAGSDPDDVKLAFYWSSLRLTGERHTYAMAIDEDDDDDEAIEISQIDTGPGGTRVRFKFPRLQPEDDEWIKMDDAMSVPFEVADRLHQMEWSSPRANGGQHWSGQVKGGELSIQYVPSAVNGGDPPRWRIGGLVEFLQDNFDADQLGVLLAEVLLQIAYFNDLAGWQQLRDAELVALEEGNITPIGKVRPVVWSKHHFDAFASRPFCAATLRELVLTDTVITEGELVSTLAELPGLMFLVIGDVPGRRASQDTPLPAAHILITDSLLRRLSWVDSSSLVPKLVDIVMMTTLAFDDNVLLDFIISRIAGCDAANEGCDDEDRELLRVEIVRQSDSRPFSPLIEDTRANLSGKTLWLSLSRSFDTASPLYQDSELKWPREFGLEEEWE